MNVWALASLLVAYLIGAIPMGYWVAKLKGIDIFKVGSGNIGATNVGRVLGRKWGFFVFLFDFAKGALPTAIALNFPPEIRNGLGIPEGVPVGVGLMCFLGHLFPIYLNFRGGKGAATGVGTVLILMPWPTLFAVLVFLITLVSSRMVSLGSVLGVVTLSVARLLLTPEPFAESEFALTLFCFAGTGLLVWKHRANLKRIWNGTENCIGAETMGESLTKVLHVLAVGLWAGSGLMFNFLAAPPIFTSFKEVVAGSPSDRTAYVDIAAGLSEEKKAQLASALAGSAVGPIFPRFFALHTICTVVATLTAIRFIKQGGRVHRMRLCLCIVGLILVLVGSPISAKVSELRLERFTNPEAVDAFANWHLLSLGLSSISVLISFVVLALAGFLTCPTSAGTPEKPLS
jgi:acyl-phosphate glycerol 3-phosphate acyltransferase